MIVPMGVATRNYTWIIIAMLIVGLSSCRSHKGVSERGPVPERSTSELLTALEAHNHDFDWWSIKSGVSIKTPDEGGKATAYIRIKKDSIIWSVVKKLGAEAVRTLVTPDDYAAINRLNGTYQQGNTRNMLDQLGVALDFVDMQHALFGNVILPDLDAVAVSREGKHYILEALDGDLQLRYYINGYSLYLDRMQMIDYRGREIDITYGDYRKSDAGYDVPYLRDYTMPYDDRGDARFTMKITTIETDVEKKTAFSIPSRYDRVD